MPELKRNPYHPIVDLKGASAGTIARHIAKAETPRQRRRLAAELVRRIGAERRRRIAYMRRISNAQMIEYRLDRKMLNL